MKKQLQLLFLILIIASFTACSASGNPCDIAATTLPVYQFTTELCEGTGLSVCLLIQDSVSCLHDYTLQVSQMKQIEAADILILSGLGLEDFMEDAIQSHSDPIIAAEGIVPLVGEEGEDPHIWLSPVLAITMVENIRDGLITRLPEHRERIIQNADSLIANLQELYRYGCSTLADLSCHELITFHDGFSYFADCFGLQILEAVEEESGSEASAADLISLITLVEENHLPAIFTEKNGSDSAATIISKETGANVFMLDMAISGDDYFESMRWNINIIKEALS